MDEYTPLIAEARNYWQNPLALPTPGQTRAFVAQLADALEAATTDRAEHDRALSEKVWDEGRNVEFILWHTTNPPQRVTPKNPYRITEENN